MNEIIKEKLSLLKELPGCYLMKDKNNNVIYVGKAKKLVNRVSSYFNKEHTGKTKKLVSEIYDFDYIITNSDKEAFLLEINLIHQYNPTYNILLKDSKAYPYIELTSLPNPMLRIARSIKNKKSKYYGPYSSSSSAYETINLLNRIYPLRKCDNLPSKVCLYYHIGQCLGPCEYKVDQKIIRNYYDEINSFLRGNTSKLYNEYKEKMNEASNALRFEDANEYKKIVQAIEHISIKQTIQLDTSDNFDVFGFHIKDDYISISTLIYKDGILRLKTNKIMQVVLDPKEFITNYIIQYYEENIVPPTIVTSSLDSKEILEEILNTKILVPSKGKYYEILVKASVNAKEQMNEKYMLSYYLLMQMISHIWLSLNISLSLGEVSFPFKYLLQPGMRNVPKGSLNEVKTERRLVREP